MAGELHGQGQDLGVHTCSECQQQVETRWHCTECEAYDLCVHCYTAKDHPHEMVKVGLGLDECPMSVRECRRLAIRRCIQSLKHARQCRNAACSQKDCQKMKRVVLHTRSCQRKTNGGCPVCKQFIALCCHHAKHCQENPCIVPLCLNIKQKLRQRRLQLRQQRFGNHLPQG
ncbi:histone lysine acetyltransferase CREBBP-like [Pipistrellus kuhlii]|uniref:histone acetyltransferase n=1 Tax=Pipistrellus kuhlii TaxID=59472 RepID=A0A7J8B196_PIPKU|nr:histone lysine acetyltransferase CREBBP-like [Pipistrellus kuhlii]KAF6392478.1 hypothetical protein mPipKuh1_007692 [Pipistrellus kuhlii]